MTPTLHFQPEEFAARRERLAGELGARGLDGLLCFAQESMYWLTGYDTFGFCFFQCLFVSADGGTHLLTRSADLRQARLVLITAVKQVIANGLGLLGVSAPESM